MMKPRLYCFLGIILAILTSTGEVIQAATPILDINPATAGPPEFYPVFDESHGNGMVGWNFAVETPMVISHVGWYDGGSNGLSQAYRIGLWQRSAGNSPTFSSNLLGLGGQGVTVPAGTASNLDGVWRVVNLPALLLLSPGEYQLGGLDSSGNTDPIRFIGTQKSNAQVTIQNFFYSELGSSQTFGPTRYGYAAFGLELGPMLFTVPEPSSVVFCCGGLLVFSRRGRWSL